MMGKPRNEAESTDQATALQTPAARTPERFAETVETDGLSIRRSRLSDLRPDDRNANVGTERGRALVEESLRRFGAGRSILVDRHGKTIAGNTTLESAIDIGLDECLVVQTDGHKLVVVQRTDLDLETDPVARALAVADNRTSEEGLSWDANQLAALQAEGVDLLSLGWTGAELGDLLALADADAVPHFGAEPPTGRLDALSPHCRTCRCREAKS